MADFADLSNDQSIPYAGNNPMDNALGLSNPDSMLAGTMRGTQNVGSGGAQIDSANNRIILTNPSDGSTVGIGIIPGSTTNEFGFFSQDAQGNLIFKIVNGVFDIYDLTTNKNIIKLGKQPDGSYGQNTAKVGFDVADGVS